MKNLALYAAAALALSISAFSGTAFAQSQFVPSTGQYGSPGTTGNANTPEAFQDRDEATLPADIKGAHRLDQHQANVKVIETTFV